MRLCHILPALLLAACSSETPTPPVDAQVAADLCVCQDGAIPPDAPAEDSPDVVAVADGADVAELLDVVDASAPADAPDVVTADAPELADLVDADALDAAGPDVADAGLDAAAMDAPDVQLADVVEDRPDVAAVADVVDAARDTGPVDAGPVVYDLNAVRTGLEVHFEGSQPPPDSLTCPDDPRGATCAIVGDTVNFYVRACYTDLTGQLRLGDAGASVLSVGTGCLGGCGTATTLRFTAGQRTGLRQSLHVQFAAPPFRGAPGFSGVPGRTVDPALADLWLLGCEIR